MHASADRLDFAPPPQPGMVRAFVLAIIAHLLLMLALTWGITWNQQVQNVAAEAELWSSVPLEAAPQAAAPPQVVQAPPLQPPPPPPPPVEKAEPPPPPPPAVKQPDIAMEREKQKQELAKERREELERQKQLEARRKQEELKRDQLAAKKEAEARRKRDELADRKEAEARKKQEELAKAAKTKKQQQDDDKRMAATRAAQMDRIRNMAGATGTGAPTATGAAQRAAGPSASYAGRVVARVRPNIVFTDDIAGNPTADVEVRTSPDGTIVNRRIIKSSGVPSWDNAVLRALDKTEVLPRDVDGRVPTPMILEFKPRS